MISRIYDFYFPFFSVLITMSENDTVDDMTLFLHRILRDHWMYYRDRNQICGYEPGRVKVKSKYRFFL